VKARGERLLLPDCERYRFFGNYHVCCSTPYKSCLRNFLPPIFFGSSYHTYVEQYKAIDQDSLIDDAGSSWPLDKNGDRTNEILNSEVFSMARARSRSRTCIRTVFRDLAMGRKAQVGKTFRPVCSRNPEDCMDVTTAIGPTLWFSGQEGLP
jgi:hypothetical protein